MAIFRRLYYTKKRRLLNEIADLEKIIRENGNPSSWEREIHAEDFEARMDRARACLAEARARLADKDMDAAKASADEGILEVFAACPVLSLSGIALCGYGMSFGSCSTLQHYLSGRFLPAVGVDPDKEVPVERPGRNGPVGINPEDVPPGASDWR